MKNRPLIFELGKKGRRAYSLPQCDVPRRNTKELLGENIIREEGPDLPEVSELDVVRHYTNLSKLNYSVDTQFYPLGSCTMKYNPKINEDVARLDGFTSVHPYQPEDTVQGALELLYAMDGMLSEITGMDRVSLQPAAGAHGELTGLMIIKAYHENRGEGHRHKIIVPDSAHGTNPASAMMVGYDVVEVKSDDRGCVDIDTLRDIVDNNVAGLMLTNPNTLGLFEEHIHEISQIIHDAGGLLYYDGANLNAIMGMARPGDMGFDVVHLNIHKTFSTPHGGGGPGSGPVGVKQDLIPFLPVPMVEKEDNRYYFDYDRPLSIGKVKSFYGNFNVLVKAYAYILSMGAKGLKEASQNAVLNANYLASMLKKYYELPYDRYCMHEFVLSAQPQKEKGVSAMDIAKGLIDYGFHPPTVYFPMIVREALMIEPTETESKETLDRFIEAMIELAKMADEDPDKIKGAPHKAPMKRLDETRAARHPVLKWERDS